MTGLVRDPEDRYSRDTAQLPGPSCSKLALQRILNKKGFFQQKKNSVLFCDIAIRSLNVSLTNDIINFQQLAPGNGPHLKLFGQGA